MSASLKQSLSGIGEPSHHPLRLRDSFGRRTPHRLRVAMDGMTDPGVGDWQEVGVALSEQGTNVSDESQGATTDGVYWFVCSNNAKQVVSFDDARNYVATFAPDPVIRYGMWADAGQPNADADENGVPVFGGDFDPHFGAPAFDHGWIYVPIQGPHGVWRFSIDGTEQFWQKASYDDFAFPGDDDLFPWCAIHPVTGVLYTCNFRTPPCLRAYDSESLEYRRPDDIKIGPAPLLLDHVQGGVFTSHGRLILSCSDDNAVFCFSSLNGHCFGAQTLGNFGNIVGSEVEGVTVRSVQFDGVPASVHIFELVNKGPLGPGDFDLHSFQVPAPQLL